MVELSDEDSVRFVEFLKNYVLITKILEEMETMEGAGTITIHFDSNISPRLIEKTFKKPIA